MTIDNAFFHSHDEDGFWTEVCVILNAPDEDKLKLSEAFLARFPARQTSGSLEQFCRYAVCCLFATTTTPERPTLAELLGAVERQQREKR
jgi:hypothetical protein